MKKQNIHVHVNIYNIISQLAVLATQLHTTGEENIRKLNVTSDHSNACNSVTEFWNRT